MCKELKELIKLATEEGRKEGWIEGWKEGQEEVRKDAAIALAKIGMPIEEIAEVIETEVTTVRIWLDKALNH